MKKRIAGINFDHMHMEELLGMVQEHPAAEIVGVCDENPDRMSSAVQNFALPKECIFTDHQACLEQTQPDFVILCPATAEHGEWTAKVALYEVDILVEKPFAASLEEADRMVDAVDPSPGNLQPARCADVLAHFTGDHPLR